MSSIQENITVQEHRSLATANTLAINVTARYYCEITEKEQIPAALAFAVEHKLALLVLGDGSNIVLSGDFDGLVLKIALRGISGIEQGDEVNVCAASGENWHQLVQYCLQRGYNGLENLSLIPGTVGAAPIQNIGAYGVELEQRFVCLEGWDLQQQQWRTLSRADCQFAYRNSIFKQALKDRFIITAVTLRLSTASFIAGEESAGGAANLSYGALAQYFSQTSTSTPTPQQVAAAVIAIRRSKLPDPARLANAGSFFKNPVISQLQAEALLHRYPELVCYPQDDGQVKLAAGWLLQQAGWKGRRVGQVGMHEQQALVLINYGQGGGADVLALARQIQQDIVQRFGVELDIEPRVY